MPPNYHLESFWESRFQHESHFEWLGDGTNTILPHIHTYLRTQPSHHGPPRLLHIGAGTSSLSHHIRHAYKKEYGDQSGELYIINTDFSETAIRRGGEADTEEKWVKVDALKWDEIHALVQNKETYDRIEDSVDQSDARFAIVVDKSTSDAISCGEDVCFTSDEGRSTLLHPAIEDHLKRSHEGATKLSPVHVLALHLAGVVRPGGIWIALSYSAERFPFLQGAAAGGSDPLRIRQLWNLECLQVVDAPNGQHNPLVFAPAVQHYVYLIRRTSVETAI